MLNFGPMKILILSPLYPPDIADPAPYIKELGKRLRDRHSVTILTYGNIPEKVEGVRIIATSKFKPLFIRIALCILKAVYLAFPADIIIVQNGASMELPGLLASIITQTPMILKIDDMLGHSRSSDKFLYTMIQRWTICSSVTVITTSENLQIAKILNIPRVDKKPIISIFEPVSQNEITQYELSWNDHLKKLETLMHHG